MQITLSGPYETLYTTAVDMWSFGCLCLNICIGKTAALKQREVITLYTDIFVTIQVVIIVFMQLNDGYCND